METVVAEIMAGNAARGAATTPRSAPTLRLAKSLVTLRQLSDRPAITVLIFRDAKVLQGFLSPPREMKTQQYADCGVLVDGAFLAEPLNPGKCH